jgi:hypothetical protein
MKDGARPVSTNEGGMQPKGDLRKNRTTTAA